MILKLDFERHQVLAFGLAPMLFAASALDVSLDYLISEANQLIVIGLNCDYAGKKSKGHPFERQLKQNHHHNLMIMMCAWNLLRIFPPLSEIYKFPIQSSLIDLHVHSIDYH